MGRHQIVEGLEKSERKKRRAQLGSLKSLVLRPTTITRYEKAFRAFVQYLNLHHIELSNTRSGLDRQVVDYLNFLWEDGESLALAGDTLSSIQHFQPSSKRNLSQSWKMLKTWQQHELPARATPFTWVTLQILLGQIHASSPQTSLGLLVAFKCLLRTGELLNIHARDFTISPDQSTILIRLGFTKTSGRNPSAGTVHITDLMLGRLLTTWLSSVKLETPLIPYTSSKFRSVFQQALVDCGLDKLNLKPYSLRRGGATDMWLSTHSYNIVQHAGRWTSERVMKQYIDDSTALLSNMTVVPSAYQRTLITQWQHVSHVEPPAGWKSRGRGRKRHK